MRDAWNDASFASVWSHGGGVEKTNPNRNQQLHVLGGLVSERCAAHQRTLKADARVLDLGVGSGLAARTLLRVMPPRSSIVGVDASQAMLQLLHAEPHPRLDGLNIGFNELEHHRDELMGADPPQEFACAVAVQSREPMHPGPPPQTPVLSNA